MGTLWGFFRSWRTFWGQICRFWGTLRGFWGTLKGFLVFLRGFWGDIWGVQGGKMAAVAMATRRRGGEIAWLQNGVGCHRNNGGSALTQNGGSFRGNGTRENCPGSKWRRSPWKQRGDCPGSKWRRSPLFPQRSPKRRRFFYLNRTPGKTRIAWERQDGNSLVLKKEIISL